MAKLTLAGLDARIKALEVRCSAIEIKNVSQDVLLATLRGEVDELMVWYRLYNAGDLPVSPEWPPANSINAMDYCHGDGITDDRINILEAIAAAAGALVYFPAGTYYHSPLDVPDGANLAGDAYAGPDACTAWLKGTVRYGSSQTFLDLKIGNTECSTRPARVASGTSFERCRFIGGGQSGVSWPNAPVLLIGSQYSCDHLTFKDCYVERNVGSDPDFSLGFNNISLTERVGVHSESILFEGCTVEGAPRMGIECYVNPASFTAPDGYKDITLRGCTFLSGDIHSVDFSDNAPTGRSSGILVEDCTIHGGGLTEVKWGYGLCLEMPLTTIIRNNTFYGSWMSMLNMTDRNNAAYSGPGTEIYGNHFDMTTGLVPTTDPPIILKRDNNIFTDNDLTGYYPGSSRIVAMYSATYNTVNYNRFHSIGGRTPVSELTGCSNNTITPNTVD